MFTNNSTLSLFLSTTHTHTHTQKYEETWNDAKKVLGNSQLLSLLKNYPKDNLTEKQVKKVNNHFTEDVTLEKMLLISKAGHGLLTWVVAIIKVSTEFRTYGIFFLFS